MAEGVQAALRIERRAIGSGEDDAGGADGGADGAGDDAHAGGAGRLVAGPGDDRRTGFADRWRSAPAAETFPHTSGDSYRAGSSDLSMPAALSTSLDHRRCATSSISVPEASAMSVARSPVRRKRT